MAPAHPVTKPEHMLPIMLVLGIMFIGICIAMNLFSRARFKKRSNVFTVAATARASNTTRRRSLNNGGRKSSNSLVGGGGARLESNCPSPMPSLSHMDTSRVNNNNNNMAAACKQQPKLSNHSSIIQHQSMVDESGRVSAMRL